MDKFVRLLVKLKKGIGVFLMKRKDLVEIYCILNEGKSFKKRLFFFYLID